MIKRVFPALFFAFALNFIASAQSINTAKLDSFFDALSVNNKQMGSVAISRNGVMVYQKAIGYSAVNGDNKTPATVKTKYRIGSVTKMYTGVMIFQLIEEKKLTIATPLSTWFPQMPNAAKITIGEMLSHRSGLHNFTDDPLYKTYMATPQTEAAMLAIMQNAKPDFEPDAKASYSNTNFVLLGYIIEKITGKPYADELKKRITSKIGLTDTYYGSKTNSANNEGYSFAYNGSWQQQPETDLSIPGGAGAIVSTPADMVKFIEALFGGKLISQASLEQMETVRDNYGMAMLVLPFNDKRSYGHGGSIDSFLSMVSYYPEDKMAIAYISNGATMAPNDVLIGILSIYFDEPYQIPSFKTMALKTEDLDKYLGEYSSTQLPLKISVTKNNTTLLAQATGQSQFPLEAADTDKFTFAAAGITMLFNPAKGEFTLLQGGQSYLFTKGK